jgi:hypothetical protein
MQPYLAKKFVDIGVMLIHAFHKLVKLVHKVADVDATHWKGLREGHGLREAITVGAMDIGINIPSNKPGAISVAYIAIDSAWPVASQHTPTTWSNSLWSLTIMG